MTYGGKSTVRDRSSGTSSSVAFTPLQVNQMGLRCFRSLLLVLMVMLCVGTGDCEPAGRGEEGG